MIFITHTIYPIQILYNISFYHQINVLILKAFCSLLVYPQAFCAEGATNADYRIRKPGATHHARFMGKSLYVLKMYILSHLYTRLTARQERGITRLTLFILTLYGKYFLQSSLTSSAPRLDLTLFYNLCSFSKIDSEIATRCLISFRRHLWYLMPEFACLSLFDEKLPIDDKQLLAVNLLSQNMPSEFQQGKPNFENPNTVLSRDEKQSPADLVTQDSWYLLKYAKIYLEKKGMSSSFA